MGTRRADASRIASRPAAKGAASRIQDEIKQSRPFASPHQECLVGLLRTTDVVRRRLAGVIESHGVTPQQFNVLRILRGAGPRGLPTLEIGERMVEQAPGITRLLDRLEAKGLVKRARCPEDRRQVFCTIEPAGLSLLQGMQAAVEKADRSALGGIGTADATRLSRLLDAVRASHPTKEPATLAQRTNRRYTGTGRAAGAGRSRRRS